MDGVNELLTAVSSTEVLIERPFAFALEPFWQFLRAAVDEVALLCQSASDRDPLSASKRDPFERRVRPVALAPSELAEVAETARARACA